MKKISTHKTIDINVSPEKLFSFISDPRNIALVFPELSEVSNLSSDPLEKGSQYNFKYLMGGSVLNGVCSIEKMKAPNLLVAHTTGLGESTWTHSVTATANGSNYAVTMEYVIPEGLISETEEAVVIDSNDKAIEHMTQRLKEKMETT